MDFHEDMKWFGLAQDVVWVGLLECCVGFAFSCTKKNKCVVHVKIQCLKYIVSYNWSYFFVNLS